MDTSITSRLDSIERRLRIYRIAFFSSLLLVAFTISNSVISSPSTGDILRVKGLVIEDSQGRPRIIMGAPAPKVAGRKRVDELVGIAYLDESGADRLTFGQSPDPMTPDGIKPRRVGGAGILIHDKEGIERGGYAVLDDQTALLTLDWPKTGEAIAISSNNQFSAIGLFHRSELGTYREAITLGAFQNNEQSYIMITDSAGTQRLRLETTGSEEPLFQRFDKNGVQIMSKPLGGP